MKKYFETNKALWDEKVVYHQGSEMYNLEGFLRGKNMLNEIELNALGDVKGKSILHLQCHFGQDSLCWARMGAHVTGVDMSPKSLELAQELNEKLGLDVTFVECNVLELKEHLEGQFDIVFTSYGTYTWLPDLDQWASVISHFLKPGGIFYIADFHPVIYMYDFPTQKFEYNYFNSGKPYEEITQGTYTNFDAPIQHKEYFWCHGLSEIITPLLKNGLTLLEFKEFDYSPYNCFENMKEVEKGKYVYNPKISIPHVFSLKMRK
jgi:2-polyprenyl-3-methyl-5-hydroxy-6-metoxy-1,4-benzoquinol methylase